MPIKFRCPLCQRKIRVRDEFAGKRGGCPNCKQPIDIPAESTLDEHDNPVGAADPGETPPVEAATATAEVEEISPKEAARLMQSRQSGREAPKSVDDTAAVPSATAGSFIRFDCPNCAKPMGFPSAMASQAATCPACRARVMIPERSGELSFLVGAVPREARTGSGARTGLAAAPREAEAGGKPPWKPVAIGAGVIVLALILGLMIGRGSGGDADAKSAPGSEKTEKSEKTIAAQTPALQVSPPAPVNGNIERVEPPPSRPKPPEEPIASIGPGPQVRPEPAVSVVPPVTSPIETKTEAAPAATLDPMQALTGRDTSSPKRVEEDEEEPGPAMVQNPAAREPAPAPTTPAVEPPLDLKPLPQDPKPEVAQPQPAQPVQPPQPAPPPAEPAKPSLADQYATIPHVPFVHLEKDPAPPLQAWIPWNFGPKYAGKRDTNVLLEDAKRVFEEAQRKHESWEKMTSLELVRVDTHHVTVHARLTEALARGVGQKLEDLTGLLQRDTRSVALTQTRPDTHELVILWDDIDYNKLIDAFEKQQPGEHWKLARMATGGMSRYTGYFNARQGLPPGPEHMALFQFGKLLILEATDGKAPAWLNEGFAALGENMVTHQNLCYSFRYEPNAVKFGENWNQDIRKFAMESKLKTWDLIFPLDLVGMSSLDYLTCYSMVSYLYKASPAMFLKLVDNIRNGMDSKTAVEKAYGRPLKDIQQMWGQWALQQR